MLILSVFTFLLLTFQVSSVIIVDQYSQFADTGDNKTFSCKQLVRNPPSEVIKWVLFINETHSNNLHVFTVGSVPKHFTTTNTANTSYTAEYNLTTLTFHNIVFSDSGDYKCIFGGAKDVSSTVTLLVSPPPTVYILSLIHI